MQKQNNCQKATYQQLQHNGGSLQENISTESMLDIDIFQLRDNINLLTSIIYMRVCIVILSTLLQTSISHLEKFNPLIFLYRDCNFIFKTIISNYIANDLMNDNSDENKHNIKALLSPALNR